jgi:hypothetical protein
LEKQFDDLSKAMSEQEVISMRQRIFNV